MKHLLFDIKRNLRKTPRIHVKSATSGKNYGSFSADAPESFTGWSEMSLAETIELKHYMANLSAVKQHLGIETLNDQADYRLRLPIALADGIDEISALCHQAGIELDIFEPVLTAIIQTLKVTTVKLQGESKAKALAVLERLGLAEYKKMDFSSQIQAVFAELLGVHNKSEKLHAKAKQLFEKDKSYSPRAIESMASGETVPARWLVACAIAVLTEEKPDVLKAILSSDDLSMLFIKPLATQHPLATVNRVLEQYQLNELKPFLATPETNRSDN